MGNQSGRGALLLLATIAQLGVAIAMIFFIRRLSDVGFNTDSGEVEEMSCSLNAGTKSDPTGVLGDLEDESLCVLGYTGASVTLFAMFALTVMMVRHWYCCNSPDLITWPGCHQHQWYER